MESQKPKIAMYVKRNFGEKLSASFDFIKENWKLMLKFTTYLLLPICLIQALSLNGMMGYMTVLADLSGGSVSSDASLMMSFFSYYSLYMFVFLIGTIALTSLIYALIRTYNERDERLQGVTLGMLRPMLLRNVKRLVVMTLFDGDCLQLFIHLCCGHCCLVGCVNTFHTHSDHPAFIRIYGSFGINGSHLLI